MINSFKYECRQIFLHISNVNAIYIVNFYCIWINSIIWF